LTKSSFYQFNARFNTVISSDVSGMMEYWEPEEPFDLPKSINFEYKAETDLYDFKKVKPSMFIQLFISTSLTNPY
jgi:hypothetical protein